MGIVVLLEMHLRREVVGGPVLVLRKLVDWLGHAKVGDLELKIGIKQDVLRFDVLVSVALEVTVIESKDQFPEVVPADLFRERVTTF